MSYTSYPPSLKFFKINVAWFIVLSIITILLSCQLSFAAPQFHGKQISQIEINAEPFINKKEMKRLLDFGTGSVYSEKLIQKGIETIFLKGFFSDIIVDAKEDTTGKVKLTFTLIPKTRIANIEFTGNDFFWDSDLTEIITIRENDEFYDKNIAQSVKKLKRYYKSVGFINADIHYKINQLSDPYKREVIFEVDEGDYAVIDKISLTFPNIEFDEDKILDVINIDIGDRLSETLIKEAGTRLDEYLIDNKYYDLDKIKFVYEETQKVRLNVVVDVPYKVKINFIGNEIYSDKKLSSFFNFIKHKSSDIKVIEENYISEMLNFYRSKGFYFAKITVGKKTQEPQDRFTIKDGEKVIDIYVDEGRKVRIVTLIFTGNTVHSDNRLANQTLTRKSGTFINEYLVQSVLNNDIKALEYLYQKKGYLDVSIQPKLLFNDDNSEVTVVFQIDEGEPTMISYLKINGVSQEHKEFVHDIIKTKVAAPINIYRLEDEKIVISKYYKDKGYYNIKVEIDSKFLPGNKVRLIYNINEGVKARIHKIIISGNDFTKKKVIRRESKLSKGDPYRQSDILAAQQKIYRLGFFEKVSISNISAAGEEEKDIVIKVKEKNCGQVEFGVGYATEEGVRGSVEVSHKNLYGYGRVASIRADADENSRRYTFYFEEPWLFNQPYDATLYLVDQYLVENSYSIRKFGATFGVKKNFTDNLLGMIQYELEFDELLDVDEDVIIPEDVGTSYRICTVSPYLVYDSRDDPFNPADGSINSFKYDNAAKEFGSQLEFQKFTGRSSWYMPLRRNITLALSFRGGYGFSIGEDDKLPINKRFYLGGRSTVRGFKSDSIGPKGEGDSPVGGNVMTNYNSELRISFGRSWGGIIFYDAGNVWMTGASVDLLDLRDAVGLGFRFITVAGPISLDVGRKLDR